MINSQIQIICVHTAFIASGGGSGIGLEIARQLGLHGSKIFLMGRRKEILQVRTVAIIFLIIVFVIIKYKINKSKINQQLNIFFLFFVFCFFVFVS
jgi:NADP-dependent 3-hydroxy acid dehydrogenase YdfG